MKTINFTYKEVLPALLDGSKTQTIRKVKTQWIKNKNNPSGLEILSEVPCPYEVGEQVQLIWNEKNTKFRRKMYEKQEWINEVVSSSEKKRDNKRIAYVLIAIILIGWIL